MPTKVKMLFAGGGSGGHITPNLALIDYLVKHGIVQKSEILYVGTAAGMEKGLVEAQQIPFRTIRAGKLRRYFDWQNFTDFFRVLIGIFQSFFIVRKAKPAVVFSKGGFIALPVAVGAWLNGIPVITHESDIVSGLANRLIKKVAQKVCLTFPKEQYDAKEVLTGLPIREIMLHGNREKGVELLNFSQKDKPILLVMGGGLGSQALNQFIWKNLFVLTKRFNIVHVTGKEKMRNFEEDRKFYSSCSWDEVQKNLRSYRAFEYLDQEQPDVFAAADIFLVRAGATTIVELALLRKLMVLVPLPTSSSRGEQGLNAEFMREKGATVVLEQDNLDANGIAVLAEVWTDEKQRTQIIHNTANLFLQDANQNIASIVQKYLVL